MIEITLVMTAALAAPADLVVVGDGLCLFDANKALVAVLDANDQTILWERAKGSAANATKREACVEATAGVPGVAAQNPACVANKITYVGRNIICGPVTPVLAPELAKDTFDVALVAAVGVGSPVHCAGTCTAISAGIYRAVPPAGVVVASDGHNVNVRSASLVLPGPRRVSVELPEPPPSRVHCAWAESSGRHAELEWDTGGTPAITQSVTLAPGSWKLSCSAEPSYQQAAAQTANIPKSIAWIIDNRSFSPATAQATLGVAIALDPNRPSTRTQAQIIARVSLLPELSDAASALATGGGGSAGGRSLGIDLPGAVEELAKVFIEIAVERSKKGAFRLLQKTLRQFVCEEVTLSREEFARVGQRMFEKWRERTEQSSTAERLRVLPATCRQIEALRLEDLASQARLLYRALLGDITELAWTATSVTVERYAAALPAEVRSIVSATIDHAGTIVIGAAGGHAVDIRREVQLLIVDLAHRSATMVQKNATVDSCAMALAFAAMSTCHAADRCDARMIADIIAHPESYFTPGACSEFLDQIEDHWAGLPALVSRGLDLLSPSTEVTTESLAKEGLTLALELLQNLLRRAGAIAIVPEVPTGLADAIATADKIRAQLPAPAGTCAPAKATLDALQDLAQKLQTRKETIAEWRATITAADAAYRTLPPECAATRELAKTIAGLNAAFDDYERDVDAYVRRWFALKAGVAGLAADCVHTPKTTDRGCFEHLVSLDASTMHDMLAKMRARGADAALIATEVEKILTKIPMLRAIASAVIDGDAAAAVVAIAKLIGDVTLEDDTGANMKKTAQFLGSLTAYAQTYVQNEDQAKTAEERHEIRKNSVGALIDAFTDRSNRGRDFVLSIGASAGARPFGNHATLNAKKEDELFVGQLALTAGLTLQFLPGESFGVGAYAHVYPVDFGQYVSFGNDVVTNNLDWNVFLSPGAQVGLLFGTAEDTLELALDVEYAPLHKVRGGEGYVRIGVLLGYYVPFFDLN